MLRAHVIKNYNITFYPHMMEPPESRSWSTCIVTSEQKESVQDICLKPASDEFVEGGGYNIGLLVGLE